MPGKSRFATTPLSLLDLAHVREGGTVEESFRNSLLLAQHAESLGYKRFWLAEHHNIRGVACSATSVLIANIGRGTSTIRVGSGGIMLPNHAPLVIAEQFGTLATLFPGRIDLGLGRAPGGDTPAMRALRGNNVGMDDRFPEALEELRGYLADARPGQRVHAYPGEGTHVPIWLLGSSGFSARLAGMLGLPFAFAAHFQPDPLLAALKLYRASFRPSEILEKPYAMVGVPILVAETDERAEFLSTTSVQMFLNLIRNVPGPLPPPVREVKFAPGEKELVEAKFRAAIVGSPRTVALKLEAFLEETQADELMVVANTYDFRDRLRSYELLADLAKQAQGQATLLTAGNR
jgi:luciferase family oxidoreductase group 1